MRRPYPHELLGKNVRFARKQKKWSQKHLASVADIDPAQLSRYLRGNVDPGLEALEKIAVALDIPFHRLFTPGPEQMKDEAQWLLSQMNNVEASKLISDRFGSSDK